jgi:hypothetical protein
LCPYNACMEWKLLEQPQANFFFKSSCPAKASPRGNPPPAPPQPPLPPPLPPASPASRSVCVSSPEEERVWRWWCQRL